MPLDIGQKVTGHRTANIVMMHCFQPGREDFRRTRAGKMPTLLVGGAAKVELPDSKEILAKLMAMTAETWTGIRDELVARFAASVPALPAPSA